jgi:hypothetical protein
MESQKDKPKRSYHCKLCDKDYSSYKTLWTHNSKYHINEKDNCCHDVVTNVVICGTSKLNCQYCQKLFNDRSNKYRHEKNCKQKDIINDKMKLELLKEENKKAEIEVKKA